MGLTRPKYSQIYDSDAKNSARVATTTSVTLTGGAPNTVDDISLALKDRVLVKSQSNTAQNGIYYVTVVGTGSNGTWARSLDADSNVKLTSGTTLSVEEGTVNAGKAFRMTSTGTIILGSSAITWTDVSGGGGASGGVDGQIQYNDTNAFGGAQYLWYNETTGTVKANAGVASTNTTSGTFIVTGGAGISGNLITGGHGQFSGLFNESTTASGVFIGNTGTGTPSPRIGFFNGNTTQNWQIDNFGGVFRWFTPGVSRMELNSAGDLSILSTTTATSTSTGALKVSGGAGISGALYVGANVTVTGNVLPSANITYNLGSPTQRWKDLYLAGNTINLDGATISSANGAITFQNSLGGSFSVTGSAGGQSTGTFGNIVANSGVVSTSTSTGALVVTGGAGISGAVNIGGALTVTGNLTVNGTTTNINTTNLVVEDKNVVLADVATPTDVTADGAGITVKGATDKTFNWVDATDAWTSSEDLNLLTGKQYEINGTAVLTATTLGSGVVNSSLTSLGTITSLSATTAVATNFSSGNIVVTNGSLTTAVATNFSSGNIVITNGSLTTAVITNLSSGNIVATNSTSGTWSTANVSLYESVTATTTNATFYPILADKTTGNTGGFSATTLTHNPSTGNLTAVGHVGNFWGPVAATTANVSSTLAVTGTSTFTGATNHAGGITASTVSAGTIGNSGATLTGTLSTAAQTNVTSVGTLTSLTTSGNLSVPAASLITGGNIRLGDWPGNSNYSSVQQAGMSGSEYGLLMGKTDKNTYLSSWTGGTVNIRGGGNNTTYQIAVGTSAITITGTVTPAANLSYDLGSTSAWWGTIYGLAQQAKYADLAERYASDEEYEPGTVVIFGGDKEITASTQDHDPRVAGVVSTNPAYLMNSDNSGVAVALTGRVPCRVQGPVNKGDVLVTSNTAGVAQKIDNTKFLPGCVVGKALVSINTNTIETIEVVVGRF